MTKAVIFDRDGVLIDSERTNVLAAEKTFAEFGISLSDDEKQAVVGWHPDEYLLPHLERHDIDRDKFKALQRQNYYELIKTTRVFHETIEFARRLKAQGLSLALCTSASRAGTDGILKMLGVEGLFDLIVANDDYSHKKPDPEPYLVTARKLGFAPADCVVIEDSGVGLASAVAAGIRCVILYNDYT